MNSEIKRLLLVEDDPGDRHLLEMLLSESGAVEFDLHHAESLDHAMQVLREKDFHLVLLDLGLPESTGLEAFTKMQKMTTKIPVIILTGLDDEETALAAVKLGAQDYLPKRNLDSTLLIRAMRYAMERHTLLNQLKDAFANIRALKGLLPICSKCKKIRDDTGYWQQVEVYIRNHSDAEFTHALCPECVKELYGDPKESKF